MVVVQNVNIYQNAELVVIQAHHSIVITVKEIIFEKVLTYSRI